MKKHNITFDLETLGSGFNSPIVQIAAIKFTDSGEIIDTFQRYIDITSLKKYSFTVDYPTLQFWFEQADEAIKSVFAPINTPKFKIADALEDLMDWIETPAKFVYWSHATFDPVILKNSLEVCGIEKFIHFKAHRDIRTLTHFAGKIIVDRKGVHHNALDDCYYQVDYIVKGIQKILTNSKPTIETKKQVLEVLTKKQTEQNLSEEFLKGYRKGIEDFIKTYKI